MTDILARQRQLIGTTQEWADNDLVIGDGEIAIEREPLGSVLFKIGDGATAYSSLPYYGGTGPNAPDPHFATEEEMFSDTDMGYGPGAGVVAAAGDPVFTGGGTFVVAAEAATEFDDETAGGVKLLRLSGFASVADLEANFGITDANTSDGDLVEAKFQYLKAGSAVTDAHLTNAAGANFYVNQSKYDLNAEALGIKFTGDDADAVENTNRILNAVNWLYSEGQGGLIKFPSEGHMKIYRPVRCRDTVGLDGRGTLLDNIINPANDGGGFGRDWCFSNGVWARQDDSVHTYYKVDAVTAGQDDAVTISSPSPTIMDGFQVNDLIMLIEAKETFGDGTFVEPAQAECNRIIAKDDGLGILYLEHPVQLDIGAGAGTIGVNPTGAFVANVDYRVAGSKTPVDNPIENPHIAKDFHVHDFRLTNSASPRTTTAWSPLSGRSGQYNSSFSNIEVVGRCSNLLWGNAHFHSTFDNFSGSFMRRAFEIKQFSHDSQYNNIRAWKRRDGWDDSAIEETVWSVGEGAARVHCTDLYANLGTANNPASSVLGALAAFTGAKDCTLDRFRFDGFFPYSAHIVYGRTGSPGGAARCKVSNGTFAVPAVVGIDDYGEDCETRDVAHHDATTFGFRVNDTSRGARLIGCEFTPAASVNMQDTDGVAPEKTAIFRNNLGITGFTKTSDRMWSASGNTSATTMAIANAGMADGQSGAFTTSSTSPVVLGDPYIIPAGALRADDYMSWSIMGYGSGTTANKAVSFRASIDDDDDEALLDPDDNNAALKSFNIPASCVNWKLDVEIKVDTAAVFKMSAVFHDLTNGTVLTSTVSSHGGLGTADHATIVQVAGSVVNAADTVGVRSIQPSFHRRGFVIG